MAAVLPAQSTYAQIVQKVRRLTACPGESSLTAVAIAQYVNDAYSSDFPYAIKLDQMRSVYSFYTRPYVDRYPLDVNYNQGVRAPMYVEGIQGSFFKERSEFFNMRPRYPTQFTPATGDGVTTSFSFTVSGPFLSKEVVIGSVDTNGSSISVTDIPISDRVGNLYVQVPNPVTFVPAQVTNPPIPGMHNSNTGNPGLETQTYIGTVNYVTGAFSMDFALANVIPASGEALNLWVSQYQTGRPYSMMFWNNEFTIRPIPKVAYKVEIETYLTPVQFLDTTDNPIVNQWWKYLAYLAAQEILRDRNDFDGVAGLQEGMKRQEALILERQGVEEIGNRNVTIFAGSVQSQGWNQSWNTGGF